MASRGAPVQAAVVAATAAEEFQRPARTRPSVAYTFATKVLLSLRQLFSCHWLYNIGRRAPDARFAMSKAVLQARTPRGRRPPARLPARRGSAIFVSEGDGAPRNRLKGLMAPAARAIAVGADSATRRLAGFFMPPRASAGGSRSGPTQRGGRSWTMCGSHRRCGSA